MFFLIWQIAKILLFKGSPLWFGAGNQKIRLEKCSKPEKQALKIVRFQRHKRLAISLSLSTFCRITDYVLPTLEHIVRSQLTTRTTRGHGVQPEVSAAALSYGSASDRRTRFSHWHAVCSTRWQCTICEFLPTGRARSVHIPLTYCDLVSWSVERADRKHALDFVKKT